MRGNKLLNKLLRGREFPDGILQPRFFDSIGSHQKAPLFVEEADFFLYPEANFL